MTQNLSPVSTDKPDYDKQSSNEIRADIDQTRASVGDKIDQLQARLDPNRLKQQAQETVQEMLTDTANSMTDYVKTHRDEMVTSLADSARRNPIPTALVGLGLGWLILESMAGPRREERRYSGRSSQQGVGAYYAPEENFNPTSNWRPSDYSSQPNYNPAYGQGSNQGYNPTTGQDFSRGYGATSNQGYNQSYGQNYGQSYNQGYNQQARNEDQPTYGNGHQHGENAISKATGAVKDSVSDIGQRVGDVAGDMTDRVGDTMGGMKDRVSDTMSDAKDKMGGVVNDMTDRMGGMVSDVGNRINDAMGGVGHQANEMRHQGMRQYNQATNQMDQWQQQARYEGQRRGQQVVHNLEDNPLIYGAVALAAGAALALLLPATRVENRVFGEMRDQVMAKGQEAFDTAKGHAQQVYEEVRPDLEQTARQIVSDVTETGKQAVKNAADQLSPVVDKAMTKGKEEALSAAKEVGVDPDKLMASSQSSSGQSSTGQTSGSQMTSSPATTMSSGTGQLSKGQSSTNIASGSSTKSSPRQGPVLNRDTLAGQWKQVKGEVKRKWGQLTDDDLTRVDGDYDKLVGAIQTRYGYTREQIDREIEDFFKNQTA